VRHAFYIKTCSDLTDAIDIYFHIGAHKTATTHLQGCFRRHPLLLKEHGALFLGPRRLRGGQEDLSHVLGVGPDQDRDQVFSDLIADHTKLILSEENFIGLMVDQQGQLETSALYPKAGERLARIAEKLHPHRLHLLLGVRNPASFVVSLYSQALMRGTFQTWEAFVAAMCLGC